MSNVISSEYANHAISVVDGISVTLAGTATTHTARKRYKRRAVTGSRKLELNEAGQFYDIDGRRRVEPHGNGKCKYLINPGKDYDGPVWPAYGNMSGQYLADPDAPRSPRAKLVTDYDRVAAELVAYEFLGPPPETWEYVTVAHLDGDRNNLNPGNLRYLVNESAIAATRSRNEIKALMRGPVTGARQQVRVRDPYGIRSRNPGDTADADRATREGENLDNNPDHLAPERTRMLERAA